MVLAQPKDQAPRRSGLQFPSHYGSRSTFPRAKPPEPLQMFPSHYGSRSEEPSIVSRPRAWTRPSKGREEERKRESERKERAKMGTDGFLASVPDFRSSAARDLALTNDFRTVALYHSLLTTHNRSCHPTMVLAQR